MTIKEFLDRLASNPDLFSAYRDDPKGVAEKEGLNPQQIHVLASHSVTRIRHAIELESGDVTGLLIHVVM